MWPDCDTGDFPGGSVFKNSLSNAGNVGSIPGQGSNIPHAAGHLNANAATTELFARNKRSHEPQPRPDAAKNKQIKKNELWHRTCRIIWKDRWSPFLAEGICHGRIGESSLEEPLSRGLKMRGYLGKAEKPVGGRAGGCVPKQRTNMVKELKAAAAGLQHVLPATPAGWGAGQGDNPGPIDLLTGNLNPVSSHSQ